MDCCISPGEGPSSEAQENGFYDIRFFGYRDETENPVIEVIVKGDRDPGYGSTSKILAQAALCLSFDKDTKDKEGGFWTPANLMGASLRMRLEKYAGLSFSVKATG